MRGKRGLSKLEDKVAENTRLEQHKENDFSKAEYKINVQKPIALFYANNEPLEREIKRTIPFTIASKRIKYPGINLTKEAKYLFSENYESEERNGRRYKEMKGPILLLDGKN